MQTIMIMTITTTMAAMTPLEIFFFFLAAFFAARATRGDALVRERRDRLMRRAWFIMLTVIIVCVKEKLNAKNAKIGEGEFK